MGVIGDRDRAEAYCSSDEIRRDLAARFELVPTMAIKPRGHDFDVEAQPLIFRHMNATGS